MVTLASAGPRIGPSNGTRIRPVPSSGPCGPDGPTATLDELSLSRVASFPSPYPPARITRPAISSVPLLFFIISSNRRKRETPRNEKANARGEHGIPRRRFEPETSDRDQARGGRSG